MRRVGKITRQKVFREVKNVNVKSLKNGSKLLEFWSGSLPQPLPKGKGFSNFNMMFRAGFCVGFGRRCVGVGRRCVGFWTLAV